MEVPGIVDLELLGSRDSGTSYVGTDIELDQLVTVRVIHSSTKIPEGRFDYLVRARGRISEIADATPIYRTGTLPGGQAYLVRPHYESSLHSVLTNGPLKERDAIEAMVPVARALSDAHARDVIHGDIKPSNILLDSENKAFVSDFGLSEFLASSASLSGAMLIPPFAPPEEFQDAPADPSADVYSFGATLFALLVGRPPFRGVGPSNPSAEMQRIIANEVPVDELPTGVDPDLTDLILACMSKRPWDRPEAQEVIEQLHALTDPNRVPTREPAAGAPTSSAKPETTKPAKPTAFTQSRTVANTKSAPLAAFASARSSAAKRQSKSTAPYLSTRRRYANASIAAARPVVKALGFRGTAFIVFVVLAVGINLAQRLVSAVQGLPVSEEVEVVSAPGGGGTSGAVSNPVSLWDVLLERKTDSFLSLGVETSLADELDTDFGDASTLEAHTVFAFGSDGIQQAQLSEVWTNESLREDVFSYHVVPGEWAFHDLLELDGESLATHSGEPIAISVVQGDVVLNNSVTVRAPSASADNGIVHPISSALRPPSMGRAPTTTVPPAETRPPLPAFTIWDSLSTNYDPTLTRLGRDTALAAELDPEFIGTGGPILYTIFIPERPPVVAGITGGTEVGEAVFGYHVVAGEFRIEDLRALDGQSLTTVSGPEIDITVVDDRVVLNGTAVINRTDNLPQNGSMHIIDMVLLPPEAVAAAPQ